MADLTALLTFATMVILFILPTCKMYKDNRKWWENVLIFLGALGGWFLFSPLIFVSYYLAFFKKTA